MEKGALEDKKLYEEFSNIIKRFNINKIIETGTYLGWSTKIICTFGLPVESVEVNSEFYIHAKKNLVNENLKLHNSNSIDFLKSMKIKKKRKLFVFYRFSLGSRAFTTFGRVRCYFEKRNQTCNNNSRFFCTR